MPHPPLGLAPPSFDVAPVARYVELTDPGAPAGPPAPGAEIPVSVRERSTGPLGRRSVPCRLR